MEYLEQFIDQYLTSEQMIEIQNYCRDNNIQVSFDFNDDVIAGSIRTLNKPFNVDTRLSYTLKEVFKISVTYGNTGLYFLDGEFNTYNEALNEIQNNDDLNVGNYQIQKVFVKK